MTQKPPRPPAIITEGVQKGGVPAWDFVRRHRHWTLPPALVPLFAIAGFALAAFRERTGAIVASAVISACVWWFAPHKWTGKDGSPRMREVWYARLSVIAAGSWLSVVSFTGLTWDMFYAALGLMLAWGIPWFIHKRPRSHEGDSAIIGEWNAWWQHHCRQWSLHGSQVIGISSKGTMETLRVQLWAGHQTVRQVADCAGLIESALEGFVRPGMVRVDKDPHNASQALVFLKREDPLLIPSGWNASMSIASVTEAAPVGFTEAGETIREKLAGNWFIIGRTRSGKSNEASVFLAAITGCDDALVWLVDMKGGRAARPWLPAVDWCAVTIEEVALMFGVLKDEIKARAANADDSEEQLRPTREVPAIFLFIDETYEVTSVSAGDGRLAAQLATISSQGMGVAIYVVVVTQYGALEESVRTEQTRGNLPNRICFAVSRAEHGQFALADYQKLDASKLKEQGSFYMQLGPEASSAPGRGVKLDHPQARLIAERHGAMPRLPLRLYASQHQETYDARWSRLPQPFWRSAPQCDAIAPSPTAATPEATVNTSQGYDATARAMAGRIEDEIAGLPDTNPAFPVSDQDVMDATERNKRKFARALADAPPEGISPRRLVAATSLSRSWIMAQLRVLTEGGAVIKPSDGMYRAVTGEDVWAAMEEIRLASARLLAEARSA
jgi:hypothetical protein